MPRSDIYSFEVLKFRYFVLTLSLIGIAGCANIPQAVPAKVSSSLHGNVHGGQQPISGASVQLWDIGFFGAGSHANYLGSPVTTDANGNFDLSGTYPCPGGYAAVYLLATGGNPGLNSGTNNSAIAEISALGSCNDLTTQTYIEVNELTTISALYPIAAFTTDYKDIGYGDWPTFENDYTMASEFVDTRTGTIPGPGAPPGYTLPIAKLNTLADVIAACINSAGGIAGDGSPCGTLFQNTTPAGGTAPTNTADAIINLSHNPTLNPVNLYNVAGPAGPYQPTLATSPSDWAIALAPTNPNSQTYPICTMWGDSLTEGNQDGSEVTVPSFLATLNACAQTSNQGVGGQTSTQIAVREGGIASTATIAGGTIPSSGSVGITFASGYEPITSQGPSAVSMTLSGVAGSATWNGAGYTFTRTAPGTAVSSPPNVPFTVNIGNLNSGFVIIWAGRNDSNNPSLVLSDIAAMVASLPTPKHFLVLSVINADNELPGTPPYLSIQSINNSLAATYPNNYLDARSLAVGDYSPSNPQDVIDHNNDVPPSSLRAVDALGVLTTAIPDAVSCNFSVNQPVGVGTTLLVGTSESIYIQASDPSSNYETVTGCLRGFGGTLAAPHPSGQGYVGIDSLHLNGPVADVFLAGRINDWIQRNDPPQ